MWKRLFHQVPDPLALCLMPDHIHLLHRRDVSWGLGLALNAYARWRNARRGVHGPVWRRQGPPEPVQGAVKLRRSVRYIHLNPCRAGLVDDPLAWAWSTHRDRVGLTVRPVVRVDPDRVRFHRYVSSDPTVRVEGTDLPWPLDLVEPGEPGLLRLRGAVSAVSRTPWQDLDARGPARKLLWRAARCMSPGSQVQQAAILGCDVSSLRRTSDRWGPELRTVASAAGDLRFEGLQPGDLRLSRGWARYRFRR